MSNNNQSPSSTESTTPSVISDYANDSYEENTDRTNGKKEKENSTGEQKLEKEQMTEETNGNTESEETQSNTKSEQNTPPGRSEIKPTILSSDTNDPNGTSQKTPNRNDTTKSTRQEDTTDYETIDLGITQVNYSNEVIDGDNKRPIIHLFCREKKSNEFVRVDVKGFKPYFYTTVSEARQMDVRNDSRFPDNPIEYTDEKGKQFESIRGKELAKVHTHIPKTVGQVRDEYVNFEADIQFPDRFLIDKGISSGVRVPKKWTDKENNIITVNHEEIEPADVSINPRVHTVDIEVDDRNGFPEADQAEEPILCLTAHDSKSDKYTIWYYNDNHKVNGDVPTDFSDYEFIHDEKPNIEVRSYPTEEEMLLDYICYVNGTQADLLVGWNMNDFDAKYIINRIERIDPPKDMEINENKLSRINEVWSGGWKGPNIKGRVVFDLLEAYKRTQFTELESYRLEAIGQKELGFGKELFDGDIGNLWEENPRQLIEYNIRDVEICVELDRQQDIIEFWNEVQQFVGCRLQDAPIPGDAVDMYVLHKVSDRYILPTKGTIEAGDEYEGGEVFDPITGIEKHVTVLDLKSLYPMCMTTINASPETKIEDPEKYDGETFRAPNGIHYRKDQDGIIREMVNELLNERENKKSLRNNHDPDEEKYELYDRQQAAVKVIMNSLYGTLGWDRFRLYDKENAAAVTATGRAVIEHTESVVEELDYEVTYGDTDSVMISLDGIQNKLESITVSDKLREKRPDWDDRDLAILQKAINVSEQIEQKINESYDEFSQTELNAEEHNFLIEFEKLYWRFLQAGKKKRYAGHIVVKEGKHVDSIDITGFETERSDIPEITKDVQTKLIEMLVQGEDIKDVRAYLNRLIEDYLAGEYSLDEIGIPSGIGKQLENYKTETAHVRGAKYANTVLETEFRQGTKPKRVYIDRVHQSFFRYCQEKLDLEPQTNETYREFKQDPDVICFTHEEQVPDTFEVDLEMMLNKTVRKPISRVLKAVDVSWDEVKDAQQQTGLEQFM